MQLTIRGKRIYYPPSALSDASERFFYNILKITPKKFVGLTELFITLLSKWSLINYRFIINGKEIKFNRCS